MPIRWINDIIIRKRLSIMSQAVYSISEYIERVQMVLENLSVGFLFIRDGKCIHANRAAALYLADDDCIGKGVTTIFEQLDSEDAKKILTTLDEHRSQRPYNFHIHAPKGLRDEVLRVGVRSIELSDGTLEEMTVVGFLPSTIDRYSAEDLLPWQVMISRLYQPAVLMGMDWRILAANEQALRFFGTEEYETIVGIDVRQIVDHRDREALLRKGRMFMEGEITAGTGRYRIRTQEDKEPRIVELATTLIRGRGQEPVALLSIARDVTEDEVARRTLLERERQLTNIFNAFPQPAYMFRKTDDDGIILIETNDRIRKLTENGILKYIGHTVEELFPAETGVPQLIRDVMNTGKQQAIELQYSHQKIVRNLHIIASCSRADTDLAILITTDITEIRQSQKQIRESEREKSIILASLSEQVRYFTGPDYRFVWVNRATVEDMGLPVEKIVGSQCYKVWLNRETPCKDCPVLQAHRSGQIQTNEMTGPSGRIFQVTGSPILDDSGNVTSIVEVVRDITEERQARLLLEEARENLQLLNDILTHDLNNIYQGVLIGLEILEESTDPQSSSSEQLDAVLKQVNRSIELIRKVQRLSQIDRIPIHLQRVPIPSIVERATETCMQAFPDRKIEFVVETPDDCPPILGDEFLFDAVLNLVHNAVKFTPKDPVRVRITIELNTKDRTVSISVEDHGPGIDDRAKETLFLRRTQGSKGGSGIGLTLVKRIVERYDGTVAVEDRIKGHPEEGARFSITIPYA